jgi:hypothetical protein
MSLSKSKESIMRVLVENFAVIRGNVTDGCEIVTPSGKVYTLKNRIKGWTILDSNGLDICGILPSASDVEYFVVNGLYSH